MLQSISPAAARRGRTVMLVDNFLMWGGFFMVIPLISIHYVGGLGWAAGAIGLVLAARQLTQQGLTVFGGALADKLGAKWLICVGMGIRTASFVLMAYAATYPLLLLSAVLAAIGGALFDAPSTAAMAALTPVEDRARFFSVLGVVRGLGMTIGPLAGAALLHLDFSWVALGAAACFAVAMAITLALMPQVQVAQGERGMVAGIAMALRDRRFMLFNALLIGYWFLWVQQTIVLPLIATELAHTTDAVSWVYTVNAVIAVALQYPVLRLFSRWLAPMPLLVLGLALMALALGSVALAATIWHLLGSVALFSLGGVLASPSAQTVAADLADPAALGSYFGVNALSLAIGGAIGNLSGGLLYGFGKSSQLPALPWLVCMAVGLVAAAGLGLMSRATSVASVRRGLEGAPAGK